MKPLLLWSIELRIWVALCVATLSEFCRSSLHLLVPGNHPTTFSLVFLSTLALYNLDGSLDAKVGLSAPTRRRQTHLLLTGLSVTLLALELTLLALELGRLSARIVALVVLGFLACASYALPVFSGRRGVKSIPGFKAPFVGFAVASACTLVPALSLQPNSSRDQLPSESWAFSMLLILILGCFCTANALLFDVPDMQRDRTDGVPTHVGQKGLRATKSLCKKFCAGGLALSLLAPAPVALGLFLLGCTLLLATRRVRETTSKGTIAFWVDGSLMLPFFVARLAKAAF